MVRAANEPAEARLHAGAQVPLEPRRRRLLARPRHRNQPARPRLEVEVGRDDMPHIRRQQPGRGLAGEQHHLLELVLPPEERVDVLHLLVEAAAHGAEDHDGEAVAGAFSLAALLLQLMDQLQALVEVVAVLVRVLDHLRASRAEEVAHVGAQRVQVALDVVRRHPVLGLECHAAVVQAVGTAVRAHRELRVAPQVPEELRAVQPHAVRSDAPRVVRRVQQQHRQARHRRGLRPERVRVQLRGGGLGHGREAEAAAAHVQMQMQAELGQLLGSRQDH
ncbi:hypothetical protein ON010_g10877 [Phytophthora cinnamomi]|nr:hypothetical protein ON010_g10877 [Phytophthora cinnamomi]